MPAQKIDLGQMFGQVVQSLSQNKAELNEADTYNKNHGDNMVQIFNLITQAFEKKKDAKPAAQLKYAATQVKKIESGSAQLYAKGLTQAAKDFKGKSVNTGNVMQLVQDLFGGGEAPKAAPQSSDLLGSLLAGLTGGGQSQQSGDQGLDAGDLLNAGLAFFSAKQSGESNMNSLVKALVSGSAMGNTTHREQSGQLVLNTLLQTIGSIGK